MTKQYVISGLEASANINVGLGKRLVITEEDDRTVKTKTPKPSWTAIGDGMKTRHFQSYPYEETLLDLSKPEAWFYKLLLKAWTAEDGYSNISHIKFTATEKTVASNAYKKLKERDLVRKVRNKVYLINPCAKIHLSLFDTLYKVWQELDKPKPKKGMYNYISFIPNGFWLKSYKTWNIKTKKFITEAKNV